MIREDCQLLLGFLGVLSVDDVDFKDEASISIRDLNG
jgi:hypothetical protein